MIVDKDSAITTEVDLDSELGLRVVDMESTLHDPICDNDSAITLAVDLDSILIGWSSCHG